MDCLERDLLVCFDEMDLLDCFDEIGLLGHLIHPDETEYAGHSTHLGEQNRPPRPEYPLGEHLSTP